MSGIGILVAFLEVIMDIIARMGVLCLLTGAQRGWKLINQDI